MQPPETEVAEDRIGASVVVTPRKDTHVILSRDFQTEVNNERDKVKKISIILLAIKEVSSEVGKGRKLVDPVKTWAYRCGRIADCVVRCHNGDALSFVEKTPLWNLKTFSCCNNTKHTASFVSKKKK